MCDACEKVAEKRRAGYFAMETTVKLLPLYGHQAEKAGAAKDQVVCQTDFERCKDIKNVTVQFKVCRLGTAEARGMSVGKDNGTCLK